MQSIPDIDWLAEHRLNEEEVVDLSFLSVNYHLERLSGEMLKVVKKIGDAQTTKYIGLDTARAALGVRPCFFDLPTMIKLNQELIAAPGGKVQVFVDVPILFRLQAKVGEGVVNLDEVKDAKLLQSFYGPTHAGVFCNALYSPVYPRLEEVGVRDFCAAMPVEIHNAHREPVTITRLLVQMERLMLFLLGERFLCNRVVMRILSATEADLEYQDDTVRAGLKKILDRRAVGERKAIGKLAALGTGRRGDLQYGF